MGRTNYSNDPRNKTKTKKEAIIGRISSKRAGSRLMKAALIIIKETERLFTSLPPVQPEI